MFAEQVGDRYLDSKNFSDPCNICKSSDIYRLQKLLRAPIVFDGSLLSWENHHCEVAVGIKVILISHNCTWELLLLARVPFGWNAQLKALTSKGHKSSVNFGGTENVGCFAIGSFGRVEMAAAAARRETVTQAKTKRLIQISVRGKPKD